MIKLTLFNKRETNFDLKRKRDIVQIYKSGILSKKTLSNVYKINLNFVYDDKKIHNNILNAGYIIDLLFDSALIDYSNIPKILITEEFKKATNKVEIEIFENELNYINYIKNVLENILEYDVVENIIKYIKTKNII